MEIVTKATGDSLTAIEFNQIPDELENLISASGQTPDSNDLHQVAKAVANFTNFSNYFATSGTANDIILSQVSPRIAPSQLEEGTRVIFNALYTNTGSATINLCSLGAKTINFNGQTLKAGDIKVGQIYEAIYNSVSDCFDIFSISKNVNVRDFGATGDGTTDDRASIQSAIDYCASNGGGAVFFPEGTYLIGSINTFNSKKCGLVIDKSLINLVSESPTTKILLSSALTNYELDCGLYIHSPNSDFSSAVNIKNIHFDCNYKCVDGIFTDNNYLINTILENLVIEKVQNVALNLNCFLIEINKVRCNYCKTGISIKGRSGGNSTSTIISGCFVENYTDYAYYLDNAYYSSLIVCCTDNNNNGTAFYIKNGHSVNLTGCGCEGVKKAIKVDYAYGLTIEDFTAISVGSADNANPTDYAFDFDEVHRATISGVEYRFNNKYVNFALGVKNKNSLLTILDDSFNYYYDTWNSSQENNIYYNNPDNIQFLSKISNLYENNQKLMTNYRKGLDYIKSYYHSSYDSTKFSKVGSPLIDKNGIVYKFDKTNYFTTSSITGSGSTKYEINYRLNTPFSLFSDSNYTLPFSIANSGNKPWSINLYTEAKKLLSFFSSTGFTTYSNCGTLTEDITSVDIKVKNDGTNFTIELYDQTGKMFSKKTSTTSGAEMPLESIVIKNSHNMSVTIGQPIYTISLPHIWVVENGIEIFNGNQSGIDVRKEDDFTNVGGVTIDAKGIVSGITSGKYITKTLNLGKILKVYATFKTPKSGDVTSFSAIWQIRTNPNIGLEITGSNVLVANSAGDQSAGGFAYEYDTWYDTIFTYNFETGEFKLQYKKSINTSYTTKSGTNTYWTTATLDNIDVDFGTMNRYYYYTGGEIDLSSIRFYNNETLIYQPCLRISYNYSKTGSKVVNILNNNKVFDLYEQFGQAPYYTMLSDGYILPLGEIYGFAGQANIIYTYVNGATMLRIWSDGYCEQKGEATANTPITFVKKYRNDDYYLPIAYSAKSETGFTPSVSGEYKAEGYLAYGEY